jgi:hypothetical protein
VMSPGPAPDEARPDRQQDPCLIYGPRVRAGSFVTKVITNLYVPQSMQVPETTSGRAAEVP